MKYKMYEVVRLRHARPDLRLTTDDLGAVVMAYEGPPNGYEVEFSDRDGYSIAVLTLMEDEISQVPASTPHKKSADGTW
jgi:hypothetical protein